MFCSPFLSRWPLDIFLIVLPCVIVLNYFLNTDFHISLVGEGRTFPKCKDLMFMPPHGSDVLNVVCKIPLRV